MDGERGGRYLLAMSDRDHGHIKVHRRLLDWEWFGDSNTVHVLLYLLLKANWQSKRWMGHEIAPGSLVTSRESIAEACGLSAKQARLALERLNRADVIVTTRAGQGQLVTLRNWAEYQLKAGEEGRPRADSRAVEGPTEGRPRATTKERKKGRREEDSPNGESDIAGSPKKSIEDRKAEFQARCAAMVAENPDRLAKTERKGFFDYWTEPGKDGKRMRFEAEKFFDLGRRMDTWMRNANNRTAAKPGGPVPAVRADLQLTLNDESSD